MRARRRPIEGEILASAFQPGLSAWMRGTARARSGLLVDVPTVTGGEETEGVREEKGGGDGGGSAGGESTGAQIVLNGVVAAAEVTDAVYGATITQEDKARIAEERETLRVYYDKVEEQRINREDERMKICKRYFIVGCFGLPLVHFLNVGFFFRVLRQHRAPFEMRKYTWLSLIVGVCQVILWIVWFVTFQFLKDKGLAWLNIRNSSSSFTSVS